MRPRWMLQDKSWSYNCIHPHIPPEVFTARNIAKPIIYILCAIISKCVPILNMHDILTFDFQLQRQKNMH